MPTSPRQTAVKVFRNGELVREKTFQQQAVNIGTDSAAHLRLADDAVSSLHAQLSIEPSGKIKITDLESAKGVFINGNKVQQAALDRGDTVTIGNTQLVIGPVQTEQVPHPTEKAVFTRMPRSPHGEAPGAIPGMMEGHDYGRKYKQKQPERTMPPERVEHPDVKQEASEQTAAEKEEKQQ
jgi:predicted component of type VI protein secretion system